MWNSAWHGDEKLSKDRNFERKTWGKLCGQPNEKSKTKRRSFYEIFRRSYKFMHVNGRVETKTNVRVVCVDRPTTSVVQPWQRPKLKSNDNTGVVQQNLMKLAVHLYHWIILHNLTTNLLIQRQFGVGHSM